MGTITLAAAGIVQLAAQGRSFAQGPDAMSAVHLSPSVLVDPAHGQVYVMDPEGGVHAISIDQGAEVWRNKSVLKPLGVATNRLVVQEETPGEARQLNIMPLDLNTGEPMLDRAIKLDLPPHVQPSIGETRDGQFEARADVRNEKTIVTWEYQGHPTQALAPGVRERLTPRPPGGVARGERIAPAAEPPAHSNRGGFAVDLANGVANRIEGEAMAAPQAPQVVAEAAQVPGLSGRKVLSADGRHFLVSKRSGDDRSENMYTLTVYNRANGEPQGSFESHMPSPRFLVSGPRVIYEAAPRPQPAGSGRVSTPREVRAVDLRTQKLAWSHPSRDLTYRGSYPP